MEKAPVNEMVLPSRLFLSKGTAERIATDINHLIRQTSEIAFIDTRKLNIKVHYNLAQELPLVTIDPIQIEQVIVNLLRNSLDALTINPESNRNLSIQTGISNDQKIKVDISDNGPGIEIDDIEKLFQPFYSNKPDNMGMGLAISRSIVEAHEGRLSATNNPEGGATFTFTLPIEQSDHD